MGHNVNILKVDLAFYHFGYEKIGFFNLWEKPFPNQQLIIFYYPTLGKSSQKQQLGKGVSPEKEMKMGSKN